MHNDTEQNLGYIESIYITYDTRKIKIQVSLDQDQWISITTIIIFDNRQENSYIYRWTITYKPIVQVC